jgi:hypothetical protein
MDNDVWKEIIFIGTAVLLSIILANMLMKNTEKEKHAAFEQGYIEACKDANKGKLKYSLVKNDDGTVEWKKVEKK